MSTEISIYHDTRRAKNGTEKYPVKLRVYRSSPIKVRKYYPLGIDLSIDEFRYVVEEEKKKDLKLELSTNEYKNIRTELEDVKARATKVVKNLSSFTFELFERKFFSISKGGEDVISYYRKKIKSLEDEAQVGTAVNYQLALKSLLRFAEGADFITFIESCTNKKQWYNEYKGKLSFNLITQGWLKEYEKWMLSQDKSYTTISIYLRTLRTIFLSAIGDSEIDFSFYPFKRENSKNGYEIPTGSKVLKNLDVEELTKLTEAQPATKDQEKARDFFLLAYYTGANMADILSWTWGNIQKNFLHFQRRKTRKQNKEQKIIKIEILPEAWAVINKYASNDRKKDSLLFPDIAYEKDAWRKRAQIQAFTRYVNQHLKPLAESVGLDPDISTNWARHTFAGMLFSAKKSARAIGALLGHASITTTENYGRRLLDSAISETMQGLRIKHTE